MTETITEYRALLLMSYLKKNRHQEIMMLLSECVSAIIYGDLLFLCMVQSKEKFAIQILW